jgi:hypothetical protein
MIPMLPLMSVDCLGDNRNQGTVTLAVEKKPPGKYLPCQFSPARSNTASPNRAVHPSFKRAFPSLLLNGIIISDFRWYISGPRTNIRRREELSFACKTDLVGAARGNRHDVGDE